MATQATPHPPEMDLDGRIEENVRSIRELHGDVARSFGSHTHALSKLTRRLARPLTLYVLLALTALWVGLNLALVARHMKAIDEAPFFDLQGLIGLSALVTAILVLIGQSRQAEFDQRRADLDLQVNLLSAQRSAKIIALLEELRRDMPSVQNRPDHEAAALSQSEDPGRVSRAVHESMKELDLDTPQSK